MLKKLLLVASIIGSIAGGEALVSDMETDVAEVKTELEESVEYTDEEKSYIWDNAWKVTENHLSDFDFGGNTFGGSRLQYDE